MSYSPSRRAKNPTTPEITVKYYLSNSKLLPEVIRAKSEGKVTPELAVMLMMLTRKYAQRPCFSGYSYKEDMISEAVANLCHNALKFNPEKSENPFAYYTSCINSSFLQILNVEKKHRQIRDQLLVDMGENPSFSFTDVARDHRQEGGDFSGELSDLKDQIAEAKVRLIKEAADKIVRDEAKAAEKLALSVETATSLLDFEDEPTGEPDETVV